MDTPSSKTGSYLVFAVAIVAVISLVVGIVALTRINKLSGQIGTSDIKGLTVRMDAAESSSRKASEDASRATTRVTGLQTDTQRAFDQVSTELASLRTSVNKLTSDAQAITDRLSTGPARASSTPSPAPNTTPASGSAEPGTLAEDGTYVIKSGDTLSTIGRQFGITYQEIQAVNPGLDPRKLRVGQKIYIPKPEQ
ncbi:MAG: LysM peptidoglycan-binding domain-containing protein [Opitutaceae bacterium]